MPGRLNVLFDRRMLLAGIAGLVALGHAGLASAQTELRFAHGQPTTDITHAAAEHFKQLVEEGTGGEVKVTIYPGGQLGKSKDMVQGVRLGTIDLTANGNPYFTAFAPKLNVLDLPYMFSGYDHVYSVLDGEIGQELLGELGQHNMKGLAFWEIGFRHLTTAETPVREPADMQGLKIRTTPNEAHLKAFELLGANPVPMNFQDVYMALQTGTIDGQENPITQIHSARFNEVQDYISMTGHAYTPLVFVMNLRKFESLTPEQQAVIEDAARKATVTQREGLAAEQERRQAELAKTMTIIEDVDVEAFRETVQEPVKADYVAEHGSELVDAIEELRPAS